MPPAMTPEAMDDIAVNAALPALLVVLMDIFEESRATSMSKLPV
jgi:hypothetical protein